MSDLSWLNPTPHAIAVYASRPLSPVAAQHSLPSGRYSLLGPDFHRLDRTSLRLAHSFNHLVGAGRPQWAGWVKPISHAPFATNVGGYQRGVAYTADYCFGGTRVDCQDTNCTP